MVTRNTFWVRGLVIANLALGCLLLPGVSQAGNVTYDCPSSNIKGWAYGPFADLDVQTSIGCTGNDSRSEFLQGTNAGGGFGSANWDVSYLRDAEYVAPGVLQLRGDGSIYVKSYQAGYYNGSFYSSHPPVDAAASPNLNLRFTVDAPTPIRLEAYTQSQRLDGGVQYEDAIVLIEGSSTVVWRLDPDPPNYKSGSFEYTLQPGKLYTLVIRPSARAQLGSCGGSCYDVPWRYMENQTLWGYKITFNYTPPVVDLKSFTLKQAEVAGCKSVSGTVTLTNPAPTGGFSVTLSDTLAAASTPAVVTVSAGTTSKSFNIPTTQVLAKQTGEVTATGAVQSLSAPLSVRPIGPLSVSLSPTSVTGGSPVSGTVKLECATNLAPIEVQLGSTNAAAAYPVATSVFVPQGLGSAAFGVATNPVLAKATASIRGTANGITKSKTLTVNVAASVSPTSLKFGSVPVGQTSAPLNATLTNKGAVPFSVGAISLTGTGASWFGQTSNCPASLAAGASCTVSVTFTPQAAASKSAKLTIATSATTTPLSVSLSGTGI